MGLARGGENPESGGVGVVEGEIRTFTDLRSRLRTTNHRRNQNLPDILQLF
jgi:hypothetical protein